MPPPRLYELTATMLGNQFRTTLNTRPQQFPWHHWVRLTYYDALTWAPGVSGGGVKASWRINEVQRAPHNRPMIALAQELQYMKDNSEICFDKISHADFAVAAAYTTIQAAGGPTILHDFFYGRKDATSNSDCNPLSNMPTEDNYADNMGQKGFTPEQIVALAYCEAFGVVQDPSHVRASLFPRFNNYYYKKLLTSQDSDNLPLQRQLLGSEELRAIVEKYAEDDKEFQNVFRGAFVQLCELGYDPNTDLVDGEEFATDHPNFKLFMSGI